MVLFQMDGNFNCIWHELKQNWMSLMGFFAAEFSGTKPTYFLLLILTCLPLAIVISPPPVNRTWGKDLCGSLQQEPGHSQHYRGKETQPKPQISLLLFETSLGRLSDFHYLYSFASPVPPQKIPFGPLAISVFSVQFCWIFLSVSNQNGARWKPRALHRWSFPALFSEVV